MATARSILAISAATLVAAALTTAAGTTPAGATPTGATPTVRGAATVHRAAVASLVAGGLTPAQAARRLSVQRANGARGARLRHAIGDRAVGSYLDKRGNAVVTVLDTAAANRVRAAGLTPRVVPHSAAALRKVQHTLDALPAVPSSSWGVDPVTDRVQVTVSDATPPADAARLRAAVARAGDLAEIRTVPGKLEPMIYDGDAIGRDDNVRCSAGFNTRANDGSGYYTTTAGHCTAGFHNWTIGPTVASDYPGTDYGLIENDVVASPQVRLYDGNGSVAPISGSGDAYVGENFCKSGSTTGLTCGTITETGRTVTYQGGNTINGLLVANTVSGHGDSGGAAFDGATAIAMVSGGNGSGQVFFYQPIQPALNEYGVTVSF